MTSVAEEILKLHGLLQQGILTQDEFTAAKQSIIRGTGDTPLTSAAAVSRPPPREAVGTLGASFFEESHTGVHLKAYNHLRTIVQNILRAPRDQRYRRLRMENATLRNELFSDPGAEPFLASLGFTYESAKLPDGRPDDVMVLKDSAVEEQALKQALATLEELEMRDNAAADAAIELGKLRRSVGLEVRRERWVAAQRAGELESFITKEFLSDVAGDLLYTALDSLDVLGTIVDNLAADPTSAKFRTLRLGNRRVRRAVCDQRGGLEFLVCVLGFELTGDSIVLPASPTSSNIIVDEQERLRCGQEMIGRIKAAVAASRAELLQQQRELARTAALAELEAARREMKPKTKDSGEKPVQNTTGGRRVPLQEALQQLLGRSDLE